MALPGCRRARASSAWSRPGQAQTGTPRRRRSTDEIRSGSPSKGTRPRETRSTKAGGTQVELLVFVGALISFDVLAHVFGPDSRGWSPALAARRADIERWSR